LDNKATKPEFFLIYKIFIGFMVSNSTFNNISVISVEETRVPGENHRPVTIH